ncbi:hypothetical protein KH5H1_51050 [Corallococcus caeni]|nr:hypothetical protein KH5H1_51050 [Corallococcus sp. KH5-1]
MGAAALLPQREGAAPNEQVIALFASTMSGLLAEGRGAYGALMTSVRRRWRGWACTRSNQARMAG